MIDLWIYLLHRESGSELGRCVTVHKMACELPKRLNPDALFNLLTRIVLLILQYLCRK